MNESFYCVICFLARGIPAFSIVSVSEFGYSERCAVVSHCFSLHFLDNTWCGISFHMFICFIYVFFLPNLCTSFTCRTALDSTYSRILEQSDDTGHPCLVSDLSGKALNFSALSMTVTHRVFFYKYSLSGWGSCPVFLATLQKKKNSSKSSMCHNWFQQNWSWQDHSLAISHM